MLIPNKGRIIVQKIEQDKKEGCLILPDKPSNEPITCRIVSVQFESFFEDRHLVVIPPYAGTKITYEGEEYIILKEDEILCYY
jgi:co-chaperonin GroES (HSP10)